VLCFQHGIQINTSLCVFLVGKIQFIRHGIEFATLCIQAPNDNKPERATKHETLGVSKLSKDNTHKHKHCSFLVTVYTQTKVTVHLWKKLCPKYWSISNSKPVLRLLLFGCILNAILSTAEGTKCLMLQWRNMVNRHKERLMRNKKRPWQMLRLFEDFQAKIRTRCLRIQSIRIRQINILCLWRHSGCYRFMNTLK
jgi:hypothetical protein